jgi:hypothetical protein
VRDRSAGEEPPRGLPTTVRITSHAVVWAVVLIPMAVTLAKGWVAFGDDAAIAARAYQSLSLHPPLVGMYSAASGGPGHYLYDPGPLLFWLLAVPVRIDPAHGLVWGAALLGGAALSLAVEVVWSTGLWLGCSVVAFVAVDLLWLNPDVFEHLAWNAYFPIPFLIAAVAMAWAVASGSWGWWPVLVVVASVAAQSHLIFTVPAAALAVVAPLVGWAIAGRPQRWRWLVVGLGLGLLCWLAPILQNFDSRGNLSALLSTGHGQPTLGVGAGLRLLAIAGAPWPIWLTDPPAGYFPLLKLLHQSAPGLGIVILGALVVIAVVAGLRRRPRLSALASVAVAFSAGLVVSFWIFPTKNTLSLDYLIPILWVVGVLLWVCGGWAVAAVAARRPARVDGSGGRPARRELTIVAGWAAVVVVLGVAAAGLWPLHAFEPTEAAVGWDPTTVAKVENVTAAIERTVPRGPVVFEVKNPGPGEFAGFGLSEGVAWRLRSDGWQPGLYSFQRAYTGLVPSPRARNVVIELHGSEVVSAVQTRCPDPRTDCGD